MSATTLPSRVDATHPVLAQLVDAAGKGFTGALEVSDTDSAGRHLKVSIFLADGQLRGVHADGWTPPAAEFALYRTGVDFTGTPDPLRAAYEMERDGQPLLDGAGVDAARRDWAYGILAGALTWAKPKINRNRKAELTGNKILPTPWQVVTADIAARVDGLESAWSVICEALATAGIPAVAAARACGMLAVQIDGNRLFNGAESLDQVAGRAGLSRYQVLEELSRALLSGASPTFSKPEPAAEPFLIPEHWEDPARAWGSVTDNGTVHVEAVVDAEPDEVEPDPEPELYEPEPIVDPEPVTEPEPEVVVAEPVPALELVPDLSVDPNEPTSAHELIQSWLGASADGSDASVRGAIVHRLLASAESEVQVRNAEVVRAGAELERTEAETQATQQGIFVAATALARAKDALGQAQRELARVQAESADIVQAADDADAHATELAQTADAHQGTLEALLEQVRAQEATVVASRAAAEEARDVAAAARKEVAEAAGPILEQAQELVELIYADTVLPAESDLSAAHQAATLAQEQHRDAKTSLAAAQVAADQARVLALTLQAEKAA